MNKIIVLDAGHGFNTAGKRTPNGDREWTLNNAVCNYIAEYLTGYNAIVQRTDDVTGATDVSLADRVTRTNKFGANFFVSIHHNALNGTWGNQTGTEVYYRTSNSGTLVRAVAGALAPKLATSVGLKNRGVKTSDFWVLSCKAPAILVEGGFMDGTTDYPIITSEKGQRAYAKAVADVLIEVLGLTKNVTTPVEEKPIVETPTPPAPTPPVSNGPYIVGDIVNLTGGYLYTTSNGANKVNTSVKSGQITKIVSGAKAPYLIGSGTGWVDSVGINNGNVADSAVSSNLLSGAKLNLNKILLYTNAVTTVPAATKTGTFYIWNNTITNGRIRITNSLSNVNKVGQVTGWVNVKDIS